MPVELALLVGDAVPEPLGVAVWLPVVDELGVVLGVADAEGVSDDDAVALALGVCNWVGDAEALGVVLGEGLPVGVCERVADSDDVKEAVPVALGDCVALVVAACVTLWDPEGVDDADGVPLPEAVTVGLGVSVELSVRLWLALPVGLGVELCDWDGVGVMDDEDDGEHTSFWPFMSMEA